jgi:hypothetical protein
MPVNGAEVVMAILNQRVQNEQPGVEDPCDVPSIGEPLLHGSLYNRSGQLRGNRPYEVCHVLS